MEPAVPPNRYEIPHYVSVFRPWASVVVHLWLSVRLSTWLSKSVCQGRAFRHTAARRIFSWRVTASKCRGLTHPGLIARPASPTPTG